MPISTVTSKGQTTVPKEVRDAPDIEPGAKLTWEIRGGNVAVTTGRPAFYRWEGFMKHGPTDVVISIEGVPRARARLTDRRELSRRRARGRSRCPAGSL